MNIQAPLLQAASHSGAFVNALSGLIFFVGAGAGARVSVPLAAISSRLAAISA
jgi:hypothetical protein